MQNSYLTPKEIKSVECPRCGAAIGEKCFDARDSTPKSKIKGWHQERKDVARKH
jgi:hypothetical protein